MNKSALTCFSHVNRRDAFISALEEPRIPACSPKSENGEPCFAEFPSASGQTTIVAFDGKEYTARRNDGTIGTGKYLIEVKGTLPKAFGETVFTYISDNQYTFEEIADDLLGARHQSLSYFLL